MFFNPLMWLGAKPLPKEVRLRHLLVGGGLFIIILAGIIWSVNAAEIPNTSVFSQTDANNNSGTVPTWAEGQAPSQVNDSARALQGAVTREWNWSHPTLTSGGSANAQTLTYSVAPVAYYNGQRFCFEAGFATTSSSTLNVNSLGAVAIKYISTGSLTDTAANTIRAGDRPCVTYRSTGPSFVLETPTSSTPYGAGGTDVALADGGTGSSLTDPNADRIMFWDDSAGFVDWLTLGTALSITGTTLNSPIESLCVAASDETSNLTTGTAKVTWRMPYAFTVTAVRMSVATAATGASLLTVDINEAGTTIISTKLTTDASELTSTTAATPPVISDSSLADDALMTVDIDQVGNTTPGKGLKVCLIGRQT